MNTNVLFNIPNIVNYIRLFLIACSIYLHRTNFVFFYSISSFLDLINGTIARYLKQTSKFGAYLDMLTDRLTSVIIVCKILERRKQTNLIALLFFGSSFTYAYFLRSFSF